MIPPLPPPLQSEITTGTSNLETTSIPAFVNLHRYLTTHALDHDVSTQAKNLENRATKVEDELHACRVHAARDAVLIRVLRDIGSGDSEGGLDGLWHVVAAFLACAVAGNLTALAGGVDEVWELMAPELATFRQRLPTVADVLETHLLKLDGLLVRMLEVQVPDQSTSNASTTNPGSKSSKIRGSRIPSSTTISSRNIPTTQSSSARPTVNSSTLLKSRHQMHQTQLESMLPRLLDSVSTTMTALLTTNDALLTSAIRHSELYTHSTLARHLTTQADFLASVADGLRLKTRVRFLQDEKVRYATDGVEEGLRGLVDGLEREDGELEERERALRDLLAEYAADEELFVRLGTGYMQVEEEIGLVAKDVERLERELGINGKGRR